MKDRHSDKTSKYATLCTNIQQNKWTVHFFAVEVGARDYCSDSVRVCLLKLGFNRKSINPILKKLSLTAVKSSFTIWLAHKSKTWEQPDSLNEEFILPNLVSKRSNNEPQKYPQKNPQKKPNNPFPSPSVKATP